MTDEVKVQIAENLLLQTKADIYRNSLQVKAYKITGNQDAINKCEKILKELYAIEKTCEDELKEIKK